MVDGSSGIKPVIHVPQQAGNNQSGWFVARRRPRQGKEAGKEAEEEAEKEAEDGQTLAVAQPDEEEHSRLVDRYV